MATKTNLGGVFTTDVDSITTSNQFLSTENVVGIIFDTSIVGGLDAAFAADSTAYNNFANGNVVELNVAADVEEAGIDASVMCGLPKYHLDTFFALTKGSQRVFVSFMDSTSDTTFEAVEKMQLASSGIIYQIGVWTGQPIANVDNGDYVVPTNNICSKLEDIAELLGGTVGVVNYDGNAPLNILLNAPVVNAETVDYTKLPDLSTYDFPKVSVLLGQAVSSEVRDIQFALNHAGDTTTYVQVGSLGAALACLASAPANESIAHVANFNLAAVMQEAELGFGLLADNGTPGGDGVTPVPATAYSTTAAFNNIKTLRYQKRNDCLHKKGYIFLTNYDGLENSIFFSSDQTLGNGQYRSIARCRVMHKSRRVVRRALLPRVHQDVAVDISTGYLSSSAIAELQNVVIQAIDLNMVEPGTSVPQISGRTCSIDSTQNVLDTDEIKVEYTLVPHGVTGVIHVVEGFSNSIG